MQYDLSNQMIVDYLQKCLRLEPMPSLTWPPAASTPLVGTLLHRHSYWEIKITVHPKNAATGVPDEIIPVPPGWMHDILPGIGALFQVGLHQFSWNMPYLGRYLVPDPGSRETATVMAILEACRCAFTGGAPEAELNRALSHSLISALAEFWKRARDSQRNYTPEIIALNYIDNHLDVPNLTLDTVAGYVGCSLRQLHYRFRRGFGTTPGEYITRARMRLAAELLADPGCDIAFAAARCGFVDRDYFSKVFKRSRGMTPGEYRKNFSPENPGKI